MDQEVHQHLHTTSVGHQVGFNHTTQAGRNTQKPIFCLATQIKYVDHTGEK